MIVENIKNQFLRRRRGRTSNLNKWNGWLNGAVLPILGRMVL